MSHPALIEPSESIDQFCEIEGISRSTFNCMCDRGEGPDLLHVGKRRLITPEAHREWRKRYTVPAVSKAPSYPPPK